MDAITLDNNGVNLDDILNDYFSSNPPFEKKEKKKNEFPDAIIISKLKDEFSECRPVFIVTGDKGFQSAFVDLKGFSCLNSLRDLFNYINKQDEMYEEIIAYFSSSEVQEEISERIKFQLEDDYIEIFGMDCDRKGYCEGFEYTDTFVEEATDVSFKLSSINEISEEFILVSVICDANISALCTYEDYDNAIWDSEEKEYFFLEELQQNEIHKAEFECNLNLSVIREGDSVHFKLSSISYDLVLDQDTRLERNLVEPEDPRISAEAEMMDALEEYYKH